MIRKHIILPLILLFSLTSCDAFTKQNILDKALQAQSGEPFFAIIYNKAFAQRFSLDETKSRKLPDNLHAIAVEFNKVNNKYTCDLHLYIDDKLDIYMPVTGKYYTGKTMSEIFFVMNYNDRDLNWNEYVMLNNMRLRFNSSLHADYAFTSSLSYKRVHRSFLPGLTIVTLNTGCEIFQRQHYPASIWIQKQNMGTYLLGNDGRGNIQHKEKNYEFPIPIAFIDKIQPYIKIADQ